MGASALVFDRPKAVDAELVFGLAPVFLETNEISLVQALPGLKATVEAKKVGISRLLFEEPAPASTDLVLGVTTTTVIDRVDGSFTGTLPELKAQVRIGSVIDLDVTGILPSLLATVVVAPTTEILVSGSLPDLGAAIVVRASIPTNFVGVLPTLNAVVTGTYLTNTERPTVGLVTASSMAASTLENGVSPLQHQAAQSSDGICLLFQDAGAFTFGISSEFEHSQSLHLANTGSMDEATSLKAATSTNMGEGDRKQQEYFSPFQEAIRSSGLVFYNQFQDGLRERRIGLQLIAQVAVKLESVVWNTVGTYAKPISIFRGVVFQDAWLPRIGVYVRPQKPVAPTPYYPGTILLFQCPPNPGPNLLFGKHPCGQATSVVVPVQRVYIVINTTSLRRVAGDIDLPVLSMSLSLDANSWTWSFSATLPSRAQGDLEPDGAGNPVEVEALINGVPYRMLVEKLSRSSSFGQSTITINGRGLSAQLDTPYAPIGNFGNTELRTARQLLDDILTLNSVALPWEIDWQMEDWDVPANLWRHQGSYINAINSVVQAAGGYLQPHPSTKTLYALHTYPQAPWEWSTVTPDYVLPAAVAVQESIEWAELARYNRVFVSGTGLGGVLGQVTRTGTDGSLVAPMVTDVLITSAIAARRRGIKELSPTGRQAIITLSLPVFPSTGIIVPGKMVQYEGIMGINRAVSVSTGQPVTRQQIQIETYA